MIAENPNGGPELRRDVALKTLLELRAVLGGQITVEMPEPWRSQVCNNVLWALACHSDPVVSRAAQRVRRDFGFSAPPAIDPDGAPAPGGAA